MSPASVQVMHDGVILPVSLSPDEIQELIDTGFLKPDDLCRADEHAPWRPLTELTKAKEQPSNWLARAKEAASGWVRVAATGTAAGERHVRSLLGGARGLLDTTRETLLLDYAGAIRQRVEAIARSETAGKVRTAAKDEAFMTKVFGAAYDCLPKPVCRFVSEAQFVEFCRRHHRSLLGSASMDDPSHAGTAPSTDGGGPHQDPAGAGPADRSTSS